MSHKKTFDPDDRLRCADAELCVNIGLGPAPFMIRARFRAYKKPNESGKNERGIMTSIGISEASPENVALTFEEIARQIRLSTRRTPRLNRLGTPIKKGGKR